MAKKVTDTIFILETERTVLRYQRKDDLDFFLKLWTDPEATKYVGGPRDKDTLIKSFNETAEDPKKEEYDLWYVTLKSTGELIGMAGIIPKEIENENFFEINYFIEKSHQNKGYATEIAKELLAYHKTVKGIKTFIAIIDRNNIPSVKAALKTGLHHWKTVIRNGKEKEIYRADY
ncbi:MAG: GNAT family N-acetyltransferase [Treponema sp.]|nr:GNAT family N-acetyltransferase [Treponema sp.]